MMGKKRKRNRKKRNRQRYQETHQEMILRLSKGRGGRSTMVIKDKTKYDRNKEKQINIEE